MDISIIGLGWYGLPLAKALLREGHHLLGSTTSAEKAEVIKSYGINSHILNPSKLPDSSLLQTDIIVLNIPPFKDQMSWFKSWSWNKDSWIIFVSSTSVLGHESENSKLLKVEEEWCTSFFPSWTILRFGGLLGNGRHPGKVLSGKTNLKGRKAPVNLIHLEDVINFTMTVIQKDLKNETFNVVSDDHRTREEFYTGYARAKGLPLPHFDQQDEDEGKIISNERMKKYYVPKKDLWDDEIKAF